MKLTKLVYICSPYSPVGWQKLFGWFIRHYRNHVITKIIGRLQDQFPYAFIGPITQSHHTAKHMANRCGAFKSWAIRDLTYISRCDEVWVVKMEGWSDSVGVKAEIRFAKKHKIKTRYIEPKTLGVVNE